MDINISAEVGRGYTAVAHNETLKYFQAVLSDFQNLTFSPF